MKPVVERPTAIGILTDIFCRCDWCVSQADRVTRRGHPAFRGRMWQRKYGESPIGFRRRFLDAHESVKAP